MKLHKPITALSIDGELMASGYTMKRLDKSEYILSNSVGMQDYFNELDKWERSKVTIPVSKESYDDLKRIAHCLFFDDIGEIIDDTLDSAIEKGINIDQLADRLEAYNHCDYPIITEKIRLKPEARGETKMFLSGVKSEADKQYHSDPPIDLDFIRMKFAENFHEHLSNSLLNFFTEHLKPVESDAVRFANFIRNNQWEVSFRGNELWHQNAEKYLSTKELYQLFKNEKQT